MRTLVLNADYTPINTISWQNAIKKMYSETDGVYPIEYYKKSIRDSVDRQHMLPSVVVLKNYISIDQNKFTFSKINVYYRDKFQCQYCGVKCSRSELTIDHVIPKSRWLELGNRGSSNIFENTVCCCQPCNIKKRNRTPKEAGMQLLSQPKKISRKQVFINKISLHDIPESWNQYLESPKDAVKV